MHLKKGSDNLHFFYDAQGKPSEVDFNGTRYGYIHNLQGDVIAIIDGSGTQVVEYTYDAWGKPLTKTGTLATTLGTLNPFRYRGYVYDEETGLYYLRSRYYNPVWGRLINADSILGKPEQLFGHNVFVYCRNNPVNYHDPSGNIAGTINPRPHIADGNNSGTKLAGAASAFGLSVIVAIIYDILCKGQAQTKEHVEETAKKNQQTFIYRGGSSTNYNLTPRPSDITGLSFYLAPPINNKYVITTMEAVNSTGVLTAVKDGVNHVSVYPTDGSLAEWIATKEDANTNPHPYTLILQKIIIDPFGRK